jgi:hypothetical protein
VSATAALLAASLLLPGASLPAAEPAAPAAPAAVKAPASLEEQLQVLNSALVESFNSGDWEMLELVADGVKAAGLKGSDLEVFALTGERDAFASNPAMGMWPDKNRILVWGLAFRAKLGGAPALAALRAKALAKLTPVEQPKPTGGAFNPASEEWKSWNKYQAELAVRNTALLALGLLGDKDAGSAAWAALQQVPGNPGWGVAGTGAASLVMAVLAADGEAGWKKLLGFCSSPEGDAAEFDRRVAVLSALTGLAGGGGPAGRSQAFKVEGKLAKTLPADAPAALRAGFVKLAEKLPEGDAPNFGILYAARTLPGLAEDAAALQALKGLKGRAKGNAAKSWDRMIDGIVNPPAKQPAAVPPATKPDPGTQKETF